MVPTVLNAKASGSQTDRRQMILLLGGRGYVGQAFRKYLESRQIDYMSISRTDCDYTDTSSLVDLIHRTKPAFLINAAGYTGKPNVDACELDRANCLAGNAVLPGIIRDACESTGLPWGHVSSGCIFTGRRGDGQGFTEDDPPNFSFRTNNSSFYSGTKALGEEVLLGSESCYVWRLRIPFDRCDGPRNYLSKLINYDTLLEAENSISHLDDFARCCVESFERKIPFGTYNVTNTGAVTTQQVVEQIREHLLPTKSFRFFENEPQFMKIAAKAPRSNCVMDNAKLRATGIRIRDVHEAIEDSLRQWVWSNSEA